MNLSQFSLLNQDNDSYVIGHPSGKSMTIPKKGLSDRAQKLISKLKKQQNFSEGSEEIEKESIPIDINSPPQLPLSSVQAEPFKLENLSPLNIMPTPVASSAPMAEPADPDVKPVPSDPSVTQTAERMPAETTGQTGQSDGTPSLDQSSPSAQEAAAPQAGLPGAKPDDYGDAIKEVKSGISADARSREKQASLYNEAANRQALNLMSADELHQNYQKSGEQFREAYSNLPPIDQNRYWNSLSTPNKIASSIALVLGGIGSGLTGQPNMGAQMINAAIERDIDSQKNTQDKAKTAWQMNREAMKDDFSTKLLMMNQGSIIAQERIKGELSKTIDPEAKARLAKTVLDLQQQNGMRSFMLSRMGNTRPETEQAHVKDLEVMRVVNPALYKDMEAKYIPGLGRTRIPVNDETRKALTGYDSINKLLDHAIDIQQRTPATGAIPGTPLYNEAQVVANAITLQSGEMFGLNRFTDSEKHLYEQNAGNIGSFFKQNSLAKLHELKNNIAMKTGSIAKNTGLMLFKTSPMDKTAIASAKTHPGPQADKILQLNGVQ